MSSTSRTALQEVEASVLYGPKDLRLEKRTIGPPLPDEVQVIVAATGICGSDLHYYENFRNGDIFVREPLTLGHECAGEIVSVGSNVDWLKPGQRVALEVGLPCGNCELCSAGRYNICRDMRFKSSAKAYPHAQGTLQTKLNHPARWCYKLPIDASYKLGALCEPLSVAIHANKRASLAPGSKVLVLGAGTIGLCVAAVAKINGASAVLIADINRKRCTFASEHGFAHKSCTIPLRNGNNTEDRIKIAQETASDLTDNLGTDGLRIGEFDAVFECSGASACLQTAIYAAKPGAKVLLIGMGNPIQMIPISAAALREIDLVGVFRYANTYESAVEMITSNDPNYPDFRKLITHTFMGLDRVEEAFEMASRTEDGEGNAVLKVVIVSSVVDEFY